MRGRGLLPPARPRRPRRGEGAEPTRAVPGPTDNPATNLLLADVLLRIGSLALRHLIERALLRRRYGRRAARAIVRGRSVRQTLTGAALARIGTGSVPGALLVGGGLAVRLLLERGKARREARRQGDAALLGQAQRGGHDADT